MGHVVLRMLQLVFSAYESIKVNIHKMSGELVMESQTIDPTQFTVADLKEQCQNEGKGFKLMLNDGKMGKQLEIGTKLSDYTIPTNLAETNLKRIGTSTCKV